MMKRLFWKFFIIIWLTMATSIAVLFAASALFQLLPLSREIERGRQTFALDIASRLLEQNGLGAAAAFAAQAGQSGHPVKLTISEDRSNEECRIDATATVRAIKSEDVCYRVVLHSREPGLAAALWPRIAPWLSALAAAAIAAYWLARYLVLPVAHLRSGLASLASGRFDIRIGDRMQGRKDEVAALTHDFDASAARLEELQKSQQQLFHDVSHELRSPLSRLQAVIGVLQQNPGKLDKMMDRIVREVERIDGLIGEILTLARLTDRSKDRLEVQTLDVVDLLNDIVADAAFEAQARGIRVLHEGVETFVANVNGELMYRALENVIRNAVKYTREGTQIIVCSRVEGDTFHVVVKDQGPGVPTSDLEKIFEPFSRGDDSIARSGYGLGLAIAKQAIERHGGRVSASIADTGGLAIALSISRVHSGSGS